MTHRRQLLTPPTVCCIYHAPKPIDESSDESSSDDSSSDDDSGLDDDRARPIGGRRGRGRDEHHGHGEGCSHNHGHGKGKGKRPASPNAYEKMPKVKEGAQARKNS
jgi:protein phosphatase 1 regulatory subunit 11